MTPPAQFLTGCAVAGVVWKLSEKADAIVTDDGRLAVACWLLDRRPISTRIENWPCSFSSLLCRVFGEKHFTWSCFFKSTIVSGIAALAWFILRLSLGATYEWPLFTPHNVWTRLGATVGILVSGLVVNSVPDYFPLWETRWVLHLMQQTRSGVIHALLLVADAIATYFTTLLAGLIFLVVIFLIEALSFRTMKHLFPINIDGGILIYFRVTTLRNSGALSAGFCYPSLVTSLWLWLYCLAAFFLKLAVRYDAGYLWLLKTFDIEKKPFQAIGLIAGILVAVIYWCAAFILRH